MIADKLAQIERFLSSKGITLTVKRRPVVSKTEIARVEATLGRGIPEQLKEVYISFSDGFEVHWHDLRSEKDWDFGRFCVPGIEQFLRDFQKFHRETLEQLENVARDFKRPEKARQVLTRMLHWAVLWDTGGDGNLVCLDLENGSVLFHHREWSFYDPYVNGHLIASSLNQLIQDWGDVCFLSFSGCPGDWPLSGRPALPNHAQKFRITNN